MKRALLSLSIVGVLSAMSMSAVAANMNSPAQPINASPGNSKSETVNSEYCDSYYDGVARANCIQQINTEWFRTEMNKDPSLVKSHHAGANHDTVPASENCNSLYGVAFTNCLQGHSKFN